MTMVFNLVDYRTVKPVRRPRLRIVEPVTMVADALPVAAPSVAIVADDAPTAERKPMPPSWLIAPPFGGEPGLRVTEPQAPYSPAPVAPVDGPYQNIRQVPRTGC